MRNFIAIAAAVAINLALVFAFQRSADEALPLPEGEVTITELALEPLPALAHAIEGEARPANL